jgi:ADP-ribosylglycohydrolase
VPGDWTDDTDQMILILENLMDNQGSVNLDQYSLSLLRWAYGGFHEMGDEGGMGIGQTVNKVLSHPLFLADSHKVAQEVWEKNGRNLAANGAVMRTAVLGVPNFTDLDKVISNTLACCKVTHADPRCQASCIAVTVAIALLLQGVEDIEAITATALEYAQKVIVEPAHKEELIQHMRYGIKELNLDDRPSIGYTYKTMGSGFYALRETNFTRAIMRVTWESGDADTNAAVAGAMLGCKLGYTKLPKRWLDNLLHKDWLYEKMEVFLGMLGLSSHA